VPAQPYQLLKMSSVSDDVGFVGVIALFEQVSCRDAFPFFGDCGGNDREIDSLAAPNITFPFHK
jgi:hypothetical protein